MNTFFIEVHQPRSGTNKLQKSALKHLKNHYHHFTTSDPEGKERQIRELIIAFNRANPRCYPLIVSKSPAGYPLLHIGVQNMTGLVIANIAMYQIRGVLQ